MIIPLIILVALIYASRTDIKTREIPDTLSLGLIFLGIAIASGTSILFWSYKPLLMSIIGLAIGTGIALLFYYTGQWGGGDAKVLMGLGSLIPLQFIQGNTGIAEFVIWNAYPIFGVFLINLLFFGAFYGVFWIFWLAVKNWKTFHLLFREARQERKMLNVRRIFLGVIILFAAVVLILKPDFFIIAGVYVILLLMLIGIYLHMIIKIVEKNYMIKKISVAKLTEGDWVIEKVKIKDAEKHIYTKTGISEKGIKMLKKMGKKNVAVKEGVPFLPSFLMAYIALLIFGNWISFFHLW
ncbi:MAG: prepilin peptidase [Candidatus Nanoarchaeia archaeon]